MDNVNGFGDHKANHISTMFVDNDIEKGKKMPIGTVTNGMKKIAEGKWVPEKKGKEAKSEGAKPDAQKEMHSQVSNALKGVPKETAAHIIEQHVMSIDQADILTPFKRSELVKTIKAKAKRAKAKPSNFTPSMNGILSNTAKNFYETGSFDKKSESKADSGKSDKDRFNELDKKLAKEDLSDSEIAEYNKLNDSLFRGGKEAKSEKKENPKAEPKKGKFDGITSVGGVKLKSKEELGKMSNLEVSKYSNALRDKRNQAKGEDKKFIQSKIDEADSLREGFGKPQSAEAVAKQMENISKTGKPELINKVANQLVKQGEDVKFKVNGYNIRYNSIQKEFQASHPEGGGEDFKTAAEAVEHAKKG